jgi:hypothetical protein
VRWGGASASSKLGDPDNQPFAGQGYKIFFADGTVISGKLDAQASLPSPAAKGGAARPL